MYLVPSKIEIPIEPKPKAKLRWWRREVISPSLLLVDREFDLSVVKPFLKDYCLIILSDGCTIYKPPHLLVYSVLTYNTV